MKCVLELANQLGAGEKDGAGSGTGGVSGDAGTGTVREVLLLEPARGGQDLTDRVPVETRQGQPWCRSGQTVVQGPAAEDATQKGVTGAFGAGRAVAGPAAILWKTGPTGTGCSILNKIWREAGAWCSVVSMMLEPAASTSSREPTDAGLIDRCRKHGCRTHNLPIDFRRLRMPANNNITHQKLSKQRLVSIQGGL